MFRIEPNHRGVYLDNPFQCSSKVQGSSPKNGLPDKAKSFTDSKHLIELNCFVTSTTNSLLLVCDVLCGTLNEVNGGYCM